jgi:nitroimidazol reductase NimA-like FMN-containing flavoprotein (pyridoxamine 5'-phosphate oxidase superfamily)
MPDIETELRGTWMDDDEIDRTLREVGYGTLALTRDDDAYGVPVSFGYDGDRVFLYLFKFGEESKKLGYSEPTQRASLTVIDVESRTEWRSVIVTGTLREVDDDEIEHVEAVIDDNAWYPAFFPPDSPVTGVQWTELQIEAATGRRGGKLP